MEKPHLLHLITSEKNASPFDVNMAYDAGWTNITPYTNVEQSEIQALVQDAIFSRSPSGLQRTGIFFGGRDTHEAMDMIQEAKKHMVPPFEVSVFADPSGAFTTAAGMVALTEKHLKDGFNQELEKSNVVILGGTGPVGVASAVICAKAGANVTLIGRSLEKAEKVSAICNDRYESKNVKPGVDADKQKYLDNADIVLNTGAAGIQLMTDEHVTTSSSLKICADTNAVPPSGIAGVDVMDSGKVMEKSPNKCLAIGALAIGNVKYKSQHECLKLMYTSEKPVYLDFEDAFKFAQKSV
tara:strand:+ start:4254 stop:5144 length:891 start_codon:yes stop_codon:yes gene_type:complete